MRGILLLILLNVFSFNSVTQERPNILLILSDDHSYPHLGCYGNENIKKFNLTPHLDSFALQGMIFTRAYTSSPQCSPSRSSIFSGQSPLALGVTRFGNPADISDRFFTDVLRENGYWVGLEGRIHHLDGSGLEAKHIIETYRELGLKNLEKRFDYVGKFKTKDQGLEQIPVKINQVLNKIPKGKPFFLYFGFNQPHRRFGKDHDKIDLNKLTLPPDWPDTQEIRLDYAQFLDDIRDMDKGFGMIESALRKRNLMNNTIVIFMGDNGEALLRGKGTLYDRGTHVPLLIRWPKYIKPDSINNNLISGVDLAPTLLSAVGLTPLPEMTGVNFLHQLKGQEGRNRSFVFAERGWHHGAIYNTDGLDLSRSITSHDFRLIYRALPMRPYTPVDMVHTNAWKDIVYSYQTRDLDKKFQDLYFRQPRPIFELFNLKEDPFELNNLSGLKEYREVEEALRVELDKWMLRERDYLPLPSDIAAAKRNNMSKGFVEIK